VEASAGVTARCKSNDQPTDIDDAKDEPCRLFNESMEVDLPIVSGSSNGAAPGPLRDNVIDLSGDDDGIKVQSE
jgi:hypothetical protein